MQQIPDVRDIVLVGGGHSHVQVLRRFGMRPEPGVRLTVVAREPHTPYSGMLPGFIAGQYPWDDIHIDLARLGAFCDARFIADEVIGVDCMSDYYDVRLKRARLDRFADSDRYRHFDFDLADTSRTLVTALAPSANRLT